MTKEAKIITANGLSGEQLINGLEYYRQHFNPIDEDICESYEILKAELANRLNAYDKMIKEDK